MEEPAAASAEQAHPIVWFATQGSAHLDAQRMRALLEPLGAEELAFERGPRVRSAIALARALRARRGALVVMEGTGIAGGATLIALSILGGTRYVVSSGDAVGPYLALSGPLAGTLGGIYERLLCRRCAGYIGWTPYLAGRALTFGAPRAMTAAGWARQAPAEGARERVRARLGIPDGALVAGVVGTLNWRARRGYAYGAELVRAVLRAQRPDLVACIIGDGPGLERLRELAGEQLGSRVLLLGRVAPEQVADHLAAFDLASLPQSVDGVGSFRYSTKFSEYLAAGLPIVTSMIPAAYDLDEGFLWRLPGRGPWSEQYVEALAALLDSLQPAELAARRAAACSAPGTHATFELAAQQRRTAAFLAELSGAPG